MDTPSIIENVDLKKQESVKEAVNLIVSEGIEIASGTPVAMIDDPTYSFAGQRGVARGSSKKGYVDVEFPNGTTVPVQASLVLPLK